MDNPDAEKEGGEERCTADFQESNPPTLASIYARLVGKTMR
jgi:hypothetical protein